MPRPTIKKKSKIFIAIVIAVALVASLIIILLVNINKVSLKLVVTTYQTNISGMLYDGEKQYDIKPGTIVDLPGDMCTQDVKIKVIDTSKNDARILINNETEQKVTTENQWLTLQSRCADAGASYHIRILKPE